MRSASSMDEPCTPRSATWTAAPRDASPGTLPVAPYPRARPADGAPAQAHRPGRANRRTARARSRASAPPKPARRRAPPAHPPNGGRPPAAPGPRNSCCPRAPGGRRSPAPARGSRSRPPPPARRSIRKAARRRCPHPIGRAEPVAATADVRGDDVVPLTQETGCDVAVFPAGAATALVEQQDGGRRRTGGGAVHVGDHDDRIPDWEAYFDGGRRRLPPAADGQRRGRPWRPAPTRRRDRLERTHSNGACSRYDPQPLLFQPNCRFRLLRHVAPWLVRTGPAPDGEEGERLLGARRIGLVGHDGPDGDAEVAAGGDDHVVIRCP